MSAKDDGVGNLPNASDPGWFERETVARASLGDDREAALNAIDLAVSGLVTGTLTRELSLYLALALDKVVKERGTLTGDTFIRAFNLVRERKRPEEQSRRLVRDMDIAAWVEIATRRGLTRADAKSRAKDLFGLENIDRNLRNAGEVREVSERAYDELFVLQGRPLPQRQ